MTTPKSLSPAAQAVIDAVLGVRDPSQYLCARPLAAATLRAAVDHIDLLIERCGSPQDAEGRMAVLDGFLAIATELEGANG
jgi:hypothetical protein